MMSLCVALSQKVVGCPILQDKIQPIYPESKNKKP